MLPVAASAVEKANSQPFFATTLVTIHKACESHRISLWTFMLRRLRAVRITT
jgi:hypothetical protein